MGRDLRRGRSWGRPLDPEARALPAPSRLGVRPPVTFRGSTDEASHASEGQVVTPIFSPRVVLHQARHVEEVELTILMPCLNEAETIGLCVEKAMSFLSTHRISGEVLVADNG